MILSSPHVHTQFCDGKSTAEEMVQAALANGCQSLGFSSHARQHFSIGFPTSVEKEQQYIAEIHRLQRAYADRIRIWLGCELDMFACNDTSPFDYLIGSVHFLPSEKGFVAVDGKPEPLQDFLMEEYHGDGLALARDYYTAYAALMRCRRPAIGGHFDIVRKSNHLLHMFDETAAQYRKHVQRALDAAMEAGTLLEVNTGGMARYNAPMPYPDRWILERWRDMGGQVILSSDCHYAPLLLSHYSEVIRLLLDIGYKTVKALGTGEKMFVDTELEPLQTSL